MAMFSNQTPKSQDMAQAQRLSPDGRVKPQANGGRKILVLSKIGMTNSLVTSCNESALNGAEISDSVKHRIA